MYNQNMVTFIHTFIEKSISEINRISKLYENDILTSVNHITTELIAVLKTNFEALLGDNFNLLGQMLDQNISNSVKVAPLKLHDAEKLIVNQYMRIEMGLQSGSSQVTNFADFKVLLTSLQNDLKAKHQYIEDNNDKEVVSDIEQSFFSIQTKLDAYFISTGLTNSNICKDIKQTVDIYQYNLLDSVADKIPALIHLSDNNIELLSQTLMQKMETPSIIPPTNNNMPPEIPMFKI
jgi:hypothetical protein